MSQGWFKLHRELFEKAIWQNSTSEQKVILITLLGMANHQGKEWEWEGKQFKASPGQFITSIESIIKRCGKGISVQNVKSAIKKFEKYDFLTNDSKKTGRLITIVNWGTYQGMENEAIRQTNKEVTDKEPTDKKELTKSQTKDNLEVTTNNNYKNYKNYKNEEGKEKGSASSQVLSLTQEKILNLLGVVSYKTWIASTEIVEEKEKIILITKNNFTKIAIEEKFKKKIEIFLGKKVEVR
ncbi:DnaA N-terminal domain-containing protein [Clostridium hydrogeniformans]|uniref:DnaA N-terminal domain-containing protein n=1 Tax=Clostridium hydrogeniformans TaxID=349933 RepID=UPI00068DEFD5|nr:DnaA N-terminal domain-containing protein [Clostridium hydrogeniformans]